MGAAVNRTKVPRSTRADLEIAYDEGRQAVANTEWRQLVMTQPTSSNGGEKIFYGSKGRMRRFHDERQPVNFNEYKMLLRLDDWEMTTTVKRNVLDDDQSGGLLRRNVTNFGREVEISQEKETWEFLHNGTSLKGFDQANLFDFNHRYVTSGGITISDVVAQSNMNLGGSQLDTTTIQVDQERFANILSDKNEVLAMRMTHVAVRRGSDNAKNAREISNSQFTVQSSTVRGQFTENVFQGSFDIIEMDYGFGSSEWLSFDLNDPEMRPVLVLEHSVSPGFNNMEFTQLLEESETGFWRNVMAFGVFGRFDWNTGDWRSAFLHGSSAFTFTPLDNESQRIKDPNVL